MDTNILMAVVLAIIFILIITCIEDAFGMLVLGMLSLVVAINLTTIFTISGIGSWSIILQGVYAFIAISAFGGSMFQTKTIFGKRE